MDTTFRRLLIDILTDRNINLSNLYNELNDLGLNIKYSSLYSYFTGVVVPPFNVAKKILNIEHVTLNDNELEQILSRSKRVSKMERQENDDVLNLNLKIKPELIDQKYKSNSRSLRNMIEMRTEELFVDDDLQVKFSALGKRKISAYVAYLIKKDLLESGFIEE